MAFALTDAGDATLVLELGDRIDSGINRQVTAVAEALGASRVAGVRDIVPTFCTVAVHFDPLRTDYHALRARLAAEAERVVPAEAPDREPIAVPVCYGGAFGPDLETLARTRGLSIAQAVELHTAATYRVFMLGFVPGFAYMGTVDPRLAVPRLSTPRARVPAGSVGIAEEQTGIYPGETPGGWQLIGRTPLRLFDLACAEPFLFEPGDRVRFHAIDARRYLEQAAGRGQAAV